ncbi:hypothetical protein Droror1_Dr00025336 [Drosera rotundifolia]
MGCFLSTFVRSEPSSLREHLKDGNPSSSLDKTLKHGLQGSVNEPSTPLAPGMMMKEESGGSASSVKLIIDDTEGLITLPYLGLGLSQCWWYGFLVLHPAV